MSTLRNINIRNGVPDGFNKKMEVQVSQKIIRGTQNKIRLRTSILNEHQESSREILGIVTSAITIGQIFKASHDNINGCYLTLESADAENIIDDIEEINDLALQANWVVTGANLPTLSTNNSSRNGSTKSMQLMTDNNDTWTHTFTAATNMLGSTIEFDYNQTRENGKVDMSINIYDGMNIS